MTRNCTSVFGILLGVAVFASQLLLGVGNVRAAMGGPDAAGYVWVDSDPPAPTITYGWIDITGTGTRVSGWTSGDDGYAGPFALGFTFGFYGNSYADVYIGTNGYVSFGQGYGSSPSTLLPSLSTPNNDVIGFGDDLYPGGVSSPDGVYYESLTGPNRFVVEFYNVPTLAGWYEQTFEIVLYETGEIRLQYALVNSIPDVIGIENSDGSIGLEYVSAPTGGLAIEFSRPPFLLSPASDFAVGTAGTTVVYPMSITNLESVADTFDLTATGILGWPVEFWNATDTALLVDTGGTAAPDTGPLAAAETFDFHVHVLIPGIAGPGAAEDSTVVGRSAAIPTAMETSLLTTLTPYALPFFDDFDPSPLPGWNASDNGRGTAWEWGTPTSGPMGCDSSTGCYGTNLDGDYTNSALADLISPPIVLPAAVTLSLQFWHWYQTESCCDEGAVWISMDGGASWTFLVEFRGSGTSWREATYDISSYAGNTINLRFRFTSDGSIVYPGWYIDDVRISVIALDLSPASATGSGTAGTTVVYPMSITNLESVADTFDLTATGILGWPVEFWNAADTAPLTNTGGSAAPDTGPLAAAAVFDFNAHVLIPGTATPGDVEDTVVTGTSVAIPAAIDVSFLATRTGYPLPFFDDFDPSPLPGWNVSDNGRGTAWEWGAPTSGPWNCNSSPNCYGTNLDSDYTNSALADLISPSIVFPAASALSLEFWHWYETESCCDEGGVWVSTDGGASWTFLVEFRGSGTSWQQVTEDLSSYAGNTINLRFRFTSDGSIVYPGWYIDDVRVNVLALDLSPSSEFSSGTAGTTVVYPMSITNLESVADTFDLTATGILGWPVEFWNAADTAPLTNTGGSAAPDTGPLAAAAVFDFNAHVLIPGTATPGDVEDTTVTATPVNRPTSMDSSRLRTMVPRVMTSPRAQVNVAVDGVASVGEWADAWREDLAANVAGNPIAGFIFAKNNANFLYVAVDATGDTTNGGSDFAAMLLDTDNDRAPTSQADDGFYVSGFMSAHFVYNAPYAMWIPEDTPFDTTLEHHQGLAGARGFGPSDESATSHAFYEFSIPLSLIGVAPGDVVGFFLGTYMFPGAGLYDGNTGMWDSWPYKGAPEIANYGYLELAPPPAASDTTPPTSSVDPLPLHQTSSTFTVSWTAVDNPGGSGVQSTTLYQRFEGGAWASVGTFTTTSHDVTVTADGVYEFYVVSRDVAGNVEAAPTRAQAYTIVGASSGSGTIAGRVVDETDQPVSGVSVTVVGTSLAASTDATGAFSIPDVPPGTYDVRFTKTDFVARTVRGVSLSAGETETLNPVVLVRESIGGGVASAEIPLWVWALIAALAAATVVMLLLLVRAQRSRPRPRLVAAAPSPRSIGPEVPPNIQSQIPPYVQPQTPPPPPQGPPPPGQ